MIYISYCQDLLNSTEQNVKSIYNEAFHEGIEAFTPPAGWVLKTNHISFPCTNIVQTLNLVLKAMT